MLTPRDYLSLFRFRFKYHPLLSRRPLHLLSDRSAPDTQLGLRLINARLSGDLEIGLGIKCARKNVIISVFVSCICPTQTEIGFLGVAFCVLAGGLLFWRGQYASEPTFIVSSCPWYAHERLKTRNHQPEKTCSTLKFLIRARFAAKVNQRFENLLQAKMEPFVIAVFEFVAKHCISSESTLVFTQLGKCQRGTKA